MAARNKSIEDRMDEKRMAEMRKAVKDHTEEEWLDQQPKHFMTMCGWPRTGKTSLCRLLRGDMVFDPNEESVHGGKCFMNIGPFGPDKTEVCLWDCSGHVYGPDEYMFVTGKPKGKGPQLRPGRLAYRWQMRKQMQQRNEFPCLICIVYDSSDRNSFKEMDMFLNWAKYAQGETGLVALIHNKSDLNAEVSPDEGQALVDGWNKKFPGTCTFHEISCKTGQGVKEMRTLLCEKIVAKPVGYKNEKYFAWQAEWNELVEDGYEPLDAEKMLLDEEGDIDEVRRLMHDESDMESRIGLW